MHCAISLRDNNIDGYPQFCKSFVFDTPGVPFLIDLQAPQILVSFLIHLRQSHVFANTQKSIQCTTIYGYM